jgi:hypothetical chaperone protein
MGVVNEGINNNDVQLLSIDQGEVFMPSAIYALHRELICEATARLLPDKNAQATYTEQRSSQLNSARRVRLVEDIPSNEQAVFVGQEAFNQYLSFPDEGYFVKSVKSFLGCSGLQAQAVHFFEDIVTVMMLTVKQRAEQSLGKSIDHTVIGRPVNFQGVYPEKSNRRAIEILTTSAKRAGFKSVEFLFEPLAAGLDFEMGLEQNRTVLVVDVGGGTTDCSMVRMGPEFRDKIERLDDVLGNSGNRVGGNDFDIQLAGTQLMPLFGINSNFKDGTAIPSQVFWRAVRTNNVGDQTIFNDKTTDNNLRQYLLDCEHKELLNRFIKLRKEKKNHQLVRVAEKTKIALSDEQSCRVDLSFAEEALACQVTREQFSNAVERQVASMIKLIDEVINQAGCQPDLVYITGGAAKAQVVREAIDRRLEGVEIIDGDHFGSVTKGLTVRAQRLFS